MSVQLDSSHVAAVNEWDFKMNTQRETPYLQATTYYFVYHINTVALYWQEKSTLLMIENKRIDNTRMKIVKCVCTQDENKGWITRKTEMVVIFKILSYWLFPYQQEKSFRFTAKMGLWQNFQLSIFVLSGEKCPLTKAIEYVTFDLSLCILVFFPF